MKYSNNLLINRILKLTNFYAFDKLIKRIEPFDVISFDIFDTLIIRNVPKSTDIYFLTANNYNKNNDIKINPEDFKKSRIAAANLAHQKAIRHGHEEIVLKDIYDCMDQKYTSISEDLMNYEIKTELSCCKVNPHLKKVYDWCLKADKKVIITSDMYLPKSIIEKILKINNYHGFEKLYLSSDLLLKKSTGSLYKHIEKEYQGFRILHIGDSIRADYLNSKKHGFSSILIIDSPNHLRHSRIKIKLSKEEKVKYKNIRKVMNSFIDPKWNEYFLYGYEVIGPLMLGFSHWLDNKIDKNDRNKVYFMSRDGYLLQQSFNKVSSSKDTNYIYISRRALSGATVCKTNGLKHLLSINDLGKKWDCKTLCYRLGIDYNDVCDIWKRYGLDDNEQIRGRDALKDTRIINFYSEIEKQVYENSLKEYELLIGYFKQIGFDEKSIIVDTGGNCTLQKNLNDIFENSRIKGYYLWKKNTDGINAESFPITSEELCLGNMTIVEYFLTSHEGTTNRFYKDDKGLIVPLTKKYEHDENTDYKIKQVQEGVLFYLEIFKDSIIKEWFDTNISKNNIISFSKYPKYREACLLGDMLVYNDNHYEKMAAPFSCFSYLSKPKNFVKDFNDSCWKIGFMKRLIRIPINYYFILKIVNKFRIKEKQHDTQKENRQYSLRCK